MHTRYLALLLFIAVVLTLHSTVAATNPALKSIKVETSSDARPKPPKPPRMMAAARACKGKAENCGGGAADNHGRRRKSNGEWV